MSGRTHRPRRAALTILVVAAASGLSLGGVQPPASAAPRHTIADGASAYHTSSALDRRGNYDARLGTLKTQLRDARGIVAKRGPAFAKFTTRLGNQAVLDFDSATGTPRNLGRLNGFLTGKSSATAKTVALRYVRTHHAVLGLSAPDLKTFRLTRQWTDIAGIRHLSFTQHARGIEVFGNGLRANVTKQGRLISLQGSPVAGLARMAAKTSTAPALSAAAARMAAARDVGGKATHSRVLQLGKATDGSTTWRNHDYARPVWFNTRDGLRLGWSTYVQAGGANLNYQHVIDAKTGATLYRHDTLNNDNGDARVFENHPGAPVGGTQHVVNLFKAGFLPKNAKNLLDGSYVAAWSDFNDDNQPGGNELVSVPGTPTGSQFKFTPFPGVDPLCSKVDVCTWDPNTANSWRANRRADVLQGFYFDSRFHNYLMHKPIGFTPQAGNFQANGDDPVLFNALDGANTDNGLPDGNHIDNANMNTPPDGIPPTMQMYLFHFPGTTDDVEPFLPSSSAFDPNVILHEYTHGLSNRLVVDASGNSTLNSVQAGAMGEAWSDYYAEDYLVTRGFRKDTAKPGQLFLGDYMEPLRTQLLRTEPIDCPVATDSPKCAPVNPALPNGGYTYGDLSAVIGVAEVHASGEIWGQTLWDLRTKLGHTVTDSLVTRAMSLSPDDPSFLDMRNSILQADLAVYGGAHRKALWQVFANRGMGFRAGTLDGTDAFPAENFSMPPKPTTARGTVSGQVVDGITGDPVAGALVAIGGHDSGLVGDYTDVTDAGGRYSIPNVLVGRYPLLSVFGPGYEIESRNVHVTADGVTSNFQIRRDWAANSGGAFVQDFDGPDFSSAGPCGPNNVNDLSEGTAWVTITGDTEAPTDTIVPKAIVIKLPQAIQLTDLAVDPTTQCGLGGSASAGDITVEASPDGTNWTEAATATFDAANRFQYNDVPVSSPIDDVLYLRVTLNAPQVPAPFTDHCPTDPDGTVFSGCTYMVLTEVEAFGPAM